MATIPVVKHKQPMKLADGNYHLYPTTIDLVKMPDGETPAFDMEDGWTAANSTHLGGRPAEDYALKGEGGGTGVPAGGSAGQTLVKQSDEDGDAEWATPNLMDMEYIDPENETADEEGHVLLTDAEKLGGKPPEHYLQPMNLLNNSDFRNPVAKNGIGYHVGNGVVYIFDQWRHLYTQYGSFTVDENGLKVQGSEFYAAQKLSHPWNRKTLTFAAKMDGQIFCGTKTVTQGVKSIFLVLPTIELNVLDDEWFCIRIPDENEHVIEWAAVYEGAYTSETLPPYVPKGYANELLACEVAENGDVFGDLRQQMAADYLTKKTIGNQLSKSTNWDDIQLGTYYFNTWAGSGGSSYPKDGMGVILCLGSSDGNIRIQYCITEHWNATRFFSQSWSAWDYSIQESKVVNNFTTTEDGYVADARTVTDLHMQINSAGFFSKSSALLWSTQTVMKLTPETNIGKTIAMIYSVDATGALSVAALSTADNLLAPSIYNIIGDKELSTESDGTTITISGFTQWGTATVQMNRKFDLLMVDP